MQTYIYKTYIYKNIKNIKYLYTKIELSIVIFENLYT
jgi:hypothetical protein